MPSNWLCKRREISSASSARSASRMRRVQVPDDVRERLRREPGAPVRDHQDGGDDRRQGAPGAHQREAPREGHERPVEGHVELGQLLARGVGHGALDRRRRPANTSSGLWPRSRPQRAAWDSSCQRTVSRSSRRAWSNPTTELRPVGEVCDEALGVELLEGAADRAAAHPELVGESGLDEGRAGGQGARDDRLAQPLHDARGVRAAGELARGWQASPGRSAPSRTAPAAVAPARCPRRRLMPHGECNPRQHIVDKWVGRRLTFVVAPL